VLAAPISGDWGELTRLWDSFSASVQTTWKEGERSRIYQVRPSAARSPPPAASHGPDPAWMRVDCRLALLRA
jgi:hypothetical protein